MRRPSKVIAVTPAAIEFEKRAIEREKKGQFRIAAHLWLQCMDVASGDVERARIAVRREQCITKGNGLRRGDYSGIGCCGVVMTKKYTLIYADPPWVYRDKAADGNRGAGFKYPVMSVLDICRLPVWDLAAENCLLAMWWVPTQPLEALKVVEAWGFRLMTMKGFTWIKCGSRQPDKLVMGMGHMTRANSEDCLFAVKGKLPPRINAGIVQSFTAPRLEHSRKPDVVREKLVQLLGDVSRIELFARQSSHGFDVWGNQCEDSAVQLHPGYALDIGGLTNAFSNSPLSPTDNQGRERAA